MRRTWLLWRAVVGRNRKRGKNVAAVETSSTPDRISIPAWTILICLSTMIFGIADHGLWTPDEPREAEIGREMSLGMSLIATYFRLHFQVLSFLVTCICVHSVIRSLANPGSS